jgi:hypothetical protein
MAQDMLTKYALGKSAARSPDRALGMFGDLKSAT